MTKNSFFIFVMVLVVGFAIWFSLRTWSSISKREPNECFVGAWRLADGDLNREVYQGRQEQAIKETRDELAYWLLNNSYVNEKEARVQELQGLLADQLQQINDMKIQRAQLSVRSLEKIQSIQNQARDVARTISDSRADIQKQMSSLRGEIQRLQRLQSQSRASQFSLNDQVQRLEKNLQGQQETVRTIEDEIRRKQESLQNLQSTEL